jgi:hypothetical protein
MRPSTIVKEIAYAWLCHAVNPTNFSLEDTFIDEIEDIANCFVSKNSVAVLFAFSDPSVEMRFHDVHSHVLPSSKSF